MVEKCLDVKRPKNLKIMNETKSITIYFYYYPDNKFSSETTKKRKARRAREIIIFGRTTIEHGNNFSFCECIYFLLFLRLN